jgi:D-alanine-D-alanine ligase
VSEDPQRTPGRPLTIGIVFETFDTYPAASGAPADAHAEYEPIATIEALEEALHALGHRPVRVGSPEVLLRAIARGGLAGLDLALNIAEGHGSRNREAWAPVLLEMAGVPCLGSDALTLSLTLDKAWANRWAAAGGIRVAPQTVFASVDAVREAELPAPFPLFVKPRWEGTAKGIRRSSKVLAGGALRAEVERIVRDYDQPALVEAFVPGPEYTVTVVGHRPPHALPVVQRALDATTGIGVHAVEREMTGGEESGGGEAPVVPGTLTPALEERLAALGRTVFDLFACRDFARADFRLDADGEPVFLEINPLPTFAPDGTFGILAELEGRPPHALLADVLREAIARVEGPRAHQDPERAR